jgi:hypothetical protein
MRWNVFFVAALAGLTITAGLGAQDNCEHLARCSEDLYLIDTVSHLPLITEYTVILADGAGSVEPFGPPGLFWFMMNMERCEPGGICFDFNIIVEYDPETCDTIRTIRLPDDNRTSGLAFHPSTDEFWYSKSFYSDKLYRMDWDGTLIDSFTAYFNITGLAIDADHDHLWCVIQGSPDQFVEYDISSGTPVLLQGPIQVPWSEGSTIWGAAGLEYNESSDMLVAVNSYQNSLDCFDDLDPGVAAACECIPLETPSANGIAQISGPETTYLPDFTFGGPFPLDLYISCIPYLCGEISGDGAITAADGYHVLNYMGSGPGPVDMRGADVNGDDVITPADGYQLLNYFGSTGGGLQCDEPCCENCP